MKFFKRFSKHKCDPSLKEKVDRLINICVKRSTGMRQSSNGCMVGVYGYDETLDQMLLKLERKVNMIIEHLELEVHHPDCTPIMRKKEKKK